MLQRRRTPAQRSAAAVAHARLQHCVGSGADRHVAVLAVAGSTGSTVPRPNSARRSSRPARKTVRLPHSTLGSTRSHPKHWVRRPCTPPTSVSNPPGTAQKVGDNNRGVHTLYRAAKADPGRRFHALHDQILCRDVMWRAWVGVRRNDGAGSIDRITPDAIEEYGVTRILDALVTDLREDRWHPMPFRRVFIPKSGSAERRPLSIRGA